MTLSLETWWIVYLTGCIIFALVMGIWMKETQQVFKAPTLVAVIFLILVWPLTLLALLTGKRLKNDRTDQNEDM